MSYSSTCILLYPVTIGQCCEFSTRRFYNCQSLVVSLYNISFPSIPDKLVLFQNDLEKKNIFFLMPNQCYEVHV